MNQFITFAEYIIERDNSALFNEAKDYDFKKEVICALSENTNDIGFKFVLEHAIQENLYENLWNGNIDETYYDAFPRSPI